MRLDFVLAYDVQPRRATLRGRGWEDAHGDAGCGVVWHSQVVVGRKMSLGATSRVRLGDWMLDAIEYGSLRPRAWLFVGWLGRDGQRQELVRWRELWCVAVCSCVYSL